MNFYQLIVIIIASSFIHCGLSANKKVIDSSVKSQPDWVKSSPSDYLVANGTGITLDEAKVNANRTLEKMVVDVTVHQMKNENHYLKQVNIDDNVAANLVQKSDFFSSIDTRNLHDVYWMRIKDFDTKEKVYEYYIHYNLDRDDMNLAIKNIALDYKLTNTLDSLKSHFPLAPNIQRFDDMYKDLMTLNSKFSDKDNRKLECEKLLSQVENNFKKLELKEILHVPGKLVVCQTINNRAVYTSKPPIVKSKGAHITSIDNYEEKWIIRYKIFRLGNEISDIITVEFDNHQNKTSREFKIEENPEKLDIRVSDSPIIIHRNKMVKFDVLSSFRGDAVIQKIVINYNDTQFTEKGLNQPLNGAGYYTIRYITPPGFYKIKTGNRVSGELHVMSKRTRQKEIYRFYNQELVFQ